MLGGTSEKPLKTSLPLSCSRNGYKSSSHIELWKTLTMKKSHAKDGRAEDMTVGL